MKEEPPVLRTRTDVDLWTSIGAVESQKNPAKREKLLVNVLRDVLAREGPVPSPILCRMIRTVALIGVTGWEEDVGRLVAKQRPEDCRPALTAASIMASHGIVSAANSYLDSVTVTTDVAFYSRVRAEVLIVNGKTSEAVAALKMSLRSNPLDVNAYAILQSISPDVNWMAYCAIDRMVARLSYSPPPSEPVGDETVLYGIYHEWYNGDRDAAANMLISTQKCDDDHPDFLLLSARMAREKGDVTAAREIYARVTSRWPDDIGVLCEAAEVFLEGDDPDLNAAHDCYRGAEAKDPGNFKVIRGLIRTYSMLGMSAEAAGVIRDFLNTESAERSDFTYAARRFMDFEYPEDAESAVSALLVSYPRDSEVRVLASRMAAISGDYISAAEHARRAVRFDKTNAEAFAQLSSVLLVLKQKSAARRMAKKAVACDSGSVFALTSMMDVCLALDHKEDALEYCNRVLAVEPGNAHALDVLSRLSVDLAVGGAVAEVPLSAETEREFVYLLRRMMDEDRYDEVKRLCAENDEKYGECVDVLRLRGNAEYGSHEYAKASASFSKAVTIAPSAELWYSKGLADEGYGDYLAALDAYDRAILLDSKNPHHWSSRGCVLENMHEYPAAVEAFNRAIELDQTSSFPLAHKAAILSRFGKLDEAMSYMDMASNADPDGPGTRRVRMKICLEAGRYEEAAGICEGLLSEHDDIEATVGLVRAEMCLGDMDSASAHLNEALGRDPRNRHLLLAARDLHSRSGDGQSLISTCHVLISIDPSDRESRLILADTLMRAGRTEEANRIFDDVGTSVAEDKEHIDDPASLLSIARSMLKVGAYDGASRNAEKLLLMDPDNEEYVVFRAQVFVRTGQMREAEFVMKEFLRREPDSIRVTEECADLKEKQEDHQEAFELYSRCLSLVNASSNPGYRARLLVKLAGVQDAMSDRPAAIRSYTEAVSLRPEDGDSARILARMLLVSGDRDAAMEVIQNALSIEESSESFAVLAQVYQAYGNADGVRDAYKGFIRFDKPLEADVLTVVTALNSVGLVSDAETLRGRNEGARRIAAEVSSDVAPSVKRCAERLMRRAYMQSTRIDDPSIRDVMDVDSELAGKALKYLEDLSAYGDVIPGTPDYERMETLSYNVVAAPRSRGMDNVDVATAYVAGHARDADEAKMLVSYIISAKESAIPSSIPQEIRRIALSYGSGATLENIMLDNRCGIMTARIIQSCI